MRFIVNAIFALLTTFTLQAQTPQEFDKRLFGYWEVVADNGMTGSLILSPNLCQYNLEGGFSSMSATCQQIWDGYSGILNLVGARSVNNFATPSYQPDRPVTVNAGSGFGLLTFSMTTFRDKKMIGHLLGAGDHVTVTLTRH